MRIATLAVCAGLLLACSRKTPEKPRPEPSAKTSAVEVPDAGVEIGEFSGTLRGIIKLAPDASVPLAPPVLSHGVKPPSMKPCPEVDENDQRVVSQAKETGGLSPIHVALTGMKSAPPAELQTHELFIDACRLRPTILGVHRGDIVKVTNRSEMALVPQLPGTSFMRGLLRGESQTFEATRVQTKVQCSFGSYCGEALVIATSHTLYDVTTSEGFFTIKNVPLDQPVTLHAWHPLFEENSAKVTLSREKPEQMIELLLTPAPPKAAEEAPKEQRDEFERKLPDGGVVQSKSRVVIKKSPK
jgi:hypothetical protein